MPVSISKKDGYRVSTPHGTKAKSTSLKKAMAQKRLLMAVEHGWKPTSKAKNPRKSAKALKTMMAQKRMHMSA